MLIAWTNKKRFLVNLNNLIEMNALICFTMIAFGVDVIYLEFFWFNILGRKWKRMMLSRQVADAPRPPGRNHLRILRHGGVFCMLGAIKIRLGRPSNFIF
jgi:hypothetical protein